MLELFSNPEKAAKWQYICTKKFKQPMERQGGRHCPGKRPRFPFRRKTGLTAECIKSGISGYDFP
ncbi:MAG: hypothetical protein LUG45_03315 [Clostridiales bacterium]|nr:hypothetical protein [Clostridiales bacterium]